MRRLVWLFPAPVRTAHTEITGFALSSIVVRGPRRTKSAADHPVERPCHVLERFAAMQADVLRAEIDRLGSELIGRHMK